MAASLSSERIVQSFHRRPGFHPPSPRSIDCPYPSPVVCRSPFIPKTFAPGIPSVLPNVTAREHPSPPRFRAARKSHHATRRFFLQVAAFPATCAATADTANFACHGGRHAGNVRWTRAGHEPEAQGVGVGVGGGPKLRMVPVRPSDNAEKINNSNRSNGTILG